MVSFLSGAGTIACNVACGLGLAVGAVSIALGSAFYNRLSEGSASGSAMTTQPVSKRSLYSNIRSIEGYGWPSAEDMEVAAHDGLQAMDYNGIQSSCVFLTEPFTISGQEALDVKASIGLCYWHDGYGCDTVSCNNLVGSSVGAFEEEQRLARGDGDEIWYASH